MTERVIRAYAARVQPIYDMLPSPVRTLAASARGWFLAHNRYSHEMFQYLNELRRHESWTRYEIEAYQVDTLQRTLDKARRTVPYYSVYLPLKLQTARDLCALPVLMRETVRANAHKFVSESTPRRERIVAATTGTSGASLCVTYNSTTARHNWAFRMRQWAWAAVEPRTPRITFFGSRIVPSQRREPPYWVHNFPENQILMSIFHLSSRSAPDYIEFLRQHAGEVLEGFPSVLGVVADYILERGEPIPMRVVFSDGEPLYPFLRSKIERAFQTSTFDCYGNTELCGLIHECEYHRMHLVSEYAYLEILDENNRPVLAGQEGYLVWTGFINETMPLIRYRIGDRGCWQENQECPCGRKFPLVVPTITRESDLLRCPDGRIFSPRAVNQLLKGTRTFRCCQFVQTGVARVLVRAVPSGGADGTGKASEEVMKVSAELRALLGSEMAVVTELAEAPLARAGGKAPLIIDQVKR